MQQPVEEKGADNARKVHVVCPLIDTHVSGHGHSHKLTQLYLWLPSQTPVFFSTPTQNLHFYIPISGQLQLQMDTFSAFQGCPLTRASTVINSSCSVEDLSCFLIKQYKNQYCFASFFIFVIVELKVWEHYIVRAIMIKGQNTFAPTLYFAQVSRDRRSKHTWSDYKW